MGRILSLLCGSLLLCSSFRAQQNALLSRIQSVCSFPEDATAVAKSLERHDLSLVETILERQTPSVTSARAEWLAVQGVVSFLRGDMSEATKKFDRAAALAPLRTEDQFTLAMACVQSGASMRATNLLLALSKTAPGQAIYPYWLGRLQYDAHRYREAVERYHEALRIDGNFVRAWNGLGLAFDMQGEMNEAEQALEKAASLNRLAGQPSPWPPHDLGVLLLRIEKLQPAEDALREALRYDSHLASGHYHLARVLEKENKFEEAINQYRMAIHQDERATDACYSLAVLYRKLGRGEEADAMFVEYRKRHGEQTK